MPAAISAKDVRVVTRQTTRVAVYAHRGDPTSLGDSIRAFVHWRKQHHLPPSRSNTFNILYQSPDRVAPKDFRLDLACEFSAVIPENTLGIVGRTWPAGECAVLRQVGSDGGLHQAIAYLYSE